MPRRILLAVSAILMTGGCATGSDACFVPETELPDRRATVSAPNLGAAARDLMSALFDGDDGAVAKLLVADPKLARVSARGKVDPLTVAVAACDKASVDLLLKAGAAPDGPNREVPLSLALRAKEPWFAARLLEAGASPDPVREDYVPLDAAIALNSVGAVRMLLDHGADVNRAGRLGDRPLHAALDMERFRLAELLIERGADPWAIDAGGASFGHAVQQPMTRPEAEEDAARLRLVGRAKALGWPDPAPNARAVRALAVEGAWPPRAALAKGAKPLTPELAARIRGDSE